MTITTCIAAVCLSLTPPHGTWDDDLHVVAERSGFTKTAAHAEVVDYVDMIAERSDRVWRTSMGTSVEGRDLPLLVIADPPVDEVVFDERLRIFVFGNIHAGEVCGKEALMMLARELALADDVPWFEDAVFLIAPIYNADGNDRMAPDNRPGQVGPDEMGQRPNAQGLDLNRDHVKLESPEARAMAKLLTDWDPHLTIDTHTTNGSRHRYTLTYASPLNPSGFAPSIEFVRDEILPTVTERLAERTGYDTFFYGNFNRAHTTWTTYSSQPRFGGPYRGLRGQMSILSEAYSYAPYEDRVKCTLEFVREIIDVAVERRDEISRLHTSAKVETMHAALNPQPEDTVGIRYRLATFIEPVTLKGYALAPTEGGRMRPTDEPAEHTVLHRGRFEATRSVRRPHAYVIPPGHDTVLETLRAHGVKTAPFSGSAIAEIYRVDEIIRSPRQFQGHHEVVLECSSRVEERAFEEGSTIVSCAQPLGTLAVYLLEPECDDGLTTWNFFDDHIAVGADFPVVRVARPEDLN